MRWARTPWWEWRFIPSYSPSSFGLARQCSLFRLLFLLRLANRAACLHARGTQQARDLLQVQLHCIGAQNLGLREADAGVPHRIHARFEIGNVLLQIHSLRRNDESAICECNSATWLNPVRMSTASFPSSGSSCCANLSSRLPSTENCNASRASKIERPNCESIVRPSSQPWPPEGSLRACSSS